MTEAVIEVIQGELIWDPVSLGISYGTPNSNAGGYRFCIQDETQNNIRGFEYSVPHYGKNAYGQAFGPLALDQTLRFCQVLASKLQLHGCVTFVSSSKFSDNIRADRANAAVLLGAFLILLRDWNVDQVAAAIPEDGNSSFVCSWAWKKTIEPVMTVRDCWGGIKIAKHFSWITTSSFLDDLCVSLACSQYRRMVLQYDATWLEPGRLIVSADPTSTVNDPNPETCDQLFPGSFVVAKDKSYKTALRGSGSSNGPDYPGGGEHDGDESITDGDESTRSNTHWETAARKEDEKSVGSKASRSNSHTGTSAIGSKRRDAPSETRSEARSKGSVASSCHSVCKPYTMGPVGQPEVDAGGGTGGALDFITWLKGQEVSTIVRTNRSDERGLIEHGGSYASWEIEECGIHHLEVPVLDMHGGIPDANVISTFLSFCGDIGTRGRGR